MGLNILRALKRNPATIHQLKINKIEEEPSEEGSSPEGQETTRLIQKKTLLLLHRFSMHLFRNLRYRLSNDTMEAKTQTIIYKIKRLQ